MVELELTNVIVALKFQLKVLDARLLNPVAKVEHVGHIGCVPLWDAIPNVDGL